MTSTVLDRGSIPTRAPCLIPEKVRVSRQVGEGMGYVPQWMLLVTARGSRASPGKALEVEGRMQKARTGLKHRLFWSWQHFLKTIPAVGAGRRM